MRRSNSICFRISEDLRDADETNNQANFVDTDFSIVKRFGTA